MAGSDAASRAASEVAGRVAGRRGRTDRGVQLRLALGGGGEVAQPGLGGAQPGVQRGVVARRLVELEGQPLEIAVDPLQGGLEVVDARVHDGDAAGQGHDLGIGLHDHRLAGGVALGQGAFEAADVAVELLEPALVPLDRLHGRGLGHDRGRAGDQDDAEGGDQGVPGAEGGGQLQHDWFRPTDLRPPQGVTR
jgi:hypothetical protein